MKGFSFFGMVHTFYNQKKPTLTARGEQLDAIRVASQGQNIVISTATAEPAKHMGNGEINKGAFTYDVRLFGGIFDLPTYPHPIFLPI